MKLSGNDEGRLERLHRLVGYLFAKDPELMSMVERLHDHKGILTVVVPLGMYEGNRYRDLVTAVTEFWESTLGDSSNLFEFTTYAPKLRIGDEEDLGPVYEHHKESLRHVA